MKMKVFMVSFFSEIVPDNVREIAHMTDGVIEVQIGLQLHDSERRVANDYDHMVAFSFPAVRTYRLPGLPVYIDDRYTTLRFGKHDMYVVFKKDLTDNPWNLLRTLMPLPDSIYNDHKNTSVAPVACGMMFVDSSMKPAVFDREDVRWH